MSVAIVDNLIRRYEDYGDWSKVEALKEARPHVEDGDYDRLENLYLEYSGYGDWNKASAIEELQYTLQLDEGDE